MNNICAILLIAGVCSLASAQTSPPPTTPCINGNPWTWKNNKWQCLMPICPVRCTWNAGAPNNARCFWGPNLPAAECPAGYQRCGSTIVNQWSVRLDNQTVGGYRCAYNFRRWMGEYPLGDKRNGPIPQ
jgi:hypothetical protein